MHIIPFEKKFIPEAVKLFLANFKKLRASVSATPPDLENPQKVAALLSHMMDVCPGVAAQENGKLIGYLGWWTIQHFRETRFTAAYVPEWAHATAQQAIEASRPGIYRALYRAASAEWEKAGCQTHAITILASDKVAERTWFWSGFGLTVIDAVRLSQPIHAHIPENLVFRKAVSGDIELLARIETEHRVHYSQPPTLMVSNAPNTPEEFALLLSDSRNSVWLALQNDSPIAYMQFEGNSKGAAQVVQSDLAFAITGAFTQPEQRGKGVAAALLEAAIQDYATHGYQYCTVDFESLNPEAAVFWMKYFEPVCLSLIRIPEKSIGSENC